MKKIVLSTITALTISATGLSAAQQFYVDEAGQVFTTSGPDRIAIENKETPVFMKGVKLEFSGTHYFGLTSATPATRENEAVSDGDKSRYPDTSTGFEMRRNYLQVKAFFNDKDYFRVTLDATKELAFDETAISASETTILDGNGDPLLDSNGDPVTATTTTTTKIPRNGFANVFIKYAYLYLDEVLPATGVEIGIVHRPWIDYEEHNSWHYRSFNKVMVEERATASESGVDLVNSADLGFNLKTKTEMFSSEIGMFNGEGYHADKDGADQENSSDLSLEWRLTGHLLGSGKKLGKNDRTKTSYANLSTFGLASKNHKDADGALNQTSSRALISEYDRVFYGIHAVYNQPEFLVAVQYISAKDEAQDGEALNWGARDYAVWSINGEFRPIQDWTVIGRYDNYTMDDSRIDGIEMTTSVAGSKIIAGLAYKYSKNVSFIASGKFIDEKFTVSTQDGYDTGESKDVYMLTTEVKW